MLRTKFILSLFCLSAVSGLANANNYSENIYIGDGTGGWSFNQSLMPLATFPVSDNSGNYASIWTDVNADGLIDLMITHCRQGVTQATDPRRIDQVFIDLAQPGSSKRGGHGSSVH